MFLLLLRCDDFSSHIYVSFCPPASSGNMLDTIYTSTETVEGTLKGWDQLLNLVLDDVEELVRGTYILVQRMEQQANQR